MDRTIEIGRSGLQNTEDRFQVLTQGLVNSQTPGYRQMSVVSRSFPLALESAEERLSASDPMKPVSEGVQVDFSQGPLQPTGRKTDLAIQGPGFFVLQAPWGEAYTRDGRLQVNAEGTLISASTGWPLQGDNGLIQIEPGSRMDISQNGVVRVNDAEIDHIRVVTFQNPQSIESVNGVILRPSAGQEALAIPVNAPHVMQGFAEQSNVNTIESNMEMLFLARLYQYDTRILQVRDQLLSRAVELARPAQ